jgi:hypothetical protein
MNILKYYVRRALNLSVAHYHPLAAVPASSHLPMLIGLGRVLQIRQVLEFGAGHFSTLCFLNRDMFPDLQRVQSFETDPEWKQRIEAQANGDHRLTITLIDPDVARVAAGCDFNSFDLVFIDNGPSREARAATIKEVVAHANDCKLVIIHDFENAIYQQAAKGALSCFCFDAFNPYTGILWNERQLGSELRSTFRQMNKAVKQHAKVTKPDDTDRWRQIVEPFAQTATTR